MLKHLCFAALLLSSFSLSVACPPATPPDPEFTANDHLPYFPINAGATHELGKAVVGSPVTETISCDGCHSTAARIGDFNCLNCHGTTAGTLEAAHELINGFVRDSDRCYRCHDDGQRGVHIDPPPPEPEPGVDAGPPPATSDHDRDDFPYSNGTPHGPDSLQYMDRASADGFTHCTACHTSGADRSATRCNECHATDDPPAETLHTGLVLNGGFTDVDDCKECHWTTPLPATLSMEAHNDASCTTHFSADCFQCHDQAARQGQPKTWAIDFAMGGEPVECAPCHAGNPRSYPSPCN
ncbi:MAG: hypothetical protein IT383_24360 [Deltaproteobacteria bacterium]|nr:hypothetical protein [Deltaproteobacteria bacterium]